MSLLFDTSASPPVPSSPPSILRNDRIIHHWVDLVQWFKTTTKDYRLDARYDEFYEMDTYYDTKQHKKLYKSDLYLVLWPEDGQIGPQNLDIVNDRGLKRMQLDFGLPLLLRVGNITRYGKDNTILILGDYIHPGTTNALIPPQCDPFEPSAIMGAGMIPTELRIEAPFVHLEETLAQNQIYMNMQFRMFAFRSTNPSEMGDLQKIATRMAKIYDLFDTSCLFDPILSAIQRLVNHMNGNPGNIVDLTYMLSKAMTDYDGEVFRLKDKILPLSGKI